MKNRLYKISLFSVILVCAANTPVGARVTVKKHNNYADGYNKVMAVRQQAEYMSQNTANMAQSVDLPITVDDKNLAKDILNNASETVNTAMLEACSMIYPTGNFKWGVPDTGIRRNPNQQCVAVVELKDAKTNEVLATANLASGDAMKCNIDMFPESGWLDGLNNVELPADEPPTLTQVEMIMNQEQKQNAGFKIAAAAIISGVAGNMLAPKPAGDDKLLGTSKTQLIDTAIGATAGAGIMAASTYSGKVVGDTIKSTAVNAATGMVVGNMAAGMSGGAGIISVVKCNVDGIEKDCVVGNVRITDSTSKYERNDNSQPLYFVNYNKNLWECDRSECADLETETCAKSCHQVPSTTLIEIKLKTGRGNKLKLMSSFDPQDWQNQGTTSYLKKEDNTGFFSPGGESYINNNVVFPVESAYFPKNGKGGHAYAVFDSLPQKIGGYKDWTSVSGLSYTYYYRNSDGTVGSKIEKENDDEEVYFDATSIDASDGALVDLSNQARTKATITGAVAGGAMGGFAGYQGAKQEVSERWTAAVREYNDSLSNFYCATGARFLSKYNDYAEIPTLKSE